MNMLKKGIINVSVATVWTTKEAPRTIDQDALTNPVKIGSWLKMISLEERRSFYNDNSLQTQVLYRQEVTILEYGNEWCEITIADQPTSRNGLGYLGFIPTCQIEVLDKSHSSTIETGQIAIVKAPTSKLISLEKEIEVSYGTIFSVIESNKNIVSVQDGFTTGTILRKDVTLTTNKDFWHNYNIETIMKEGELFLGLPYLWGGVSAYGFDCSGFIYLLHRSNGLIIPRDANDQALIGEKVQWEDRKRGDILFFAREKGTRRIHHVGLYYGDDKMLHAPSTGKKIEIIPISSYENFANLCLIKRLGK